MNTFSTFKFTVMVVMMVVSLVLAGCIKPIEAPQAEVNPRPGLIFVDYRNLNGGDDGVALIDLDPESDDFGKIIQRYDIGKGVLPHHLYWNRDQTRLYTTALGASMLYEIALEKEENGTPRMAQITPIDVEGNIMGEDMYFTEDGSRYYVTFMGGKGGDRDGSVGVFDAATNQLREVITAPAPEDPSTGKPFILWPHGISANEDLGLLMFTSSLHPAGKSVGNTVTAVDMNTHQPVKTYLIGDTWGELSFPMEVVLLRDDLPPYALVTTTEGGDIWVAPYDEQTKTFGEFVKQVEGEDAGLGAALEFYIYTDQAGQRELYVTFAQPGVINVYSLEDLPKLTLKRTLPANAGAHHLVFFTTKSSREVVLVQNNLINLEGLNSGTLMAVDIHTGEVLKTLDLPAEYGLLPESVEGAYGNGFDVHH